MTKPTGSRSRRGWPRPTVREGSSSSTSGGPSDKGPYHAGNFVPEVKLDPSRIFDMRPRNERMTGAKKRRPFGATVTRSTKR